MRGGLASPPMETPGSEGGVRTSFTTVRPAAPTRNFPWPDGGGKVLHLMAQDATSTEIVRLLSLSSEAANYNCVSNILRKLQVAGRKQTIIRAREAGLGQDRT